MTTRLPGLRRVVATLLVLVGWGSVVGGCYYVGPAYPPPPVPPGSVFVPGRWVWTGYGWAWQPGHWIAIAPPPAGQAPPSPQPVPPAPATPPETPPSIPEAPKPPAQ